MHDVNLTVFDFDYDLTWWAFLISADERVYSRFGGSDGPDPSALLSVDGLKHTMRLVLEEHKRSKGTMQAPPKIVRPMDLFEMKGKCMHCHQVNEAFYKAEKKKKKEFSLAKVRYLPLAEDIGVTISIDKGNVIDKVVKDSAAAKAGLRAGDTLRQVRGTPILSQGDLMWTLKYGPSAGPLPLTFQRGTETLDVVLDLPAGWKDSPDLSWRKSAAKLK